MSRAATECESSIIMYYNVVSLLGLVLQLNVNHPL